MDAILMWAEQVRSGANFGVKSSIPRVPVIDGRAEFAAYHEDTFWIDLYANERGGERLGRLWPQIAQDGHRYWHADPLHCLR